MREIKFRFWDEPNQTMRSWDDWKRLATASVLFGSQDSPARIIPLQYTGLKDKNGKEIFEGDIVKWTLSKGWENPFSGQFLREDTTSISEVYFEEGCFMLKTPDCGLRTLLFGEFNRAEISDIIGNIYENPELLK